jgi:hypothetical protein
LIGETGVSHTWDPIPTRIHEGGCCFTFLRAGGETPKEQALSPFVDKREAKRRAREVLWDAWEKYHHYQPGKLHDTELHTRFVAGLFADFVIDNIDLAQQLMAHFTGNGGEGPKRFAIVTELERRVKDSILQGLGRVRKEDEGKPCPNCKRLYKDHSEDEIRACFGKLIFKERDNPDQNPNLPG